MCEEMFMYSCRPDGTWSLFFPFPSAEALGYYRNAPPGQICSASLCRHPLISSHSAVRDGAQSNPDGEREPFVNCEMAGNRRDDFHQHHGDGHEETKARNKPFDRRRFRWAW